MQMAVDDMSLKRIKRLAGVITALGTPLDDDNNLHDEGMRRQIDYQVRAGIDGLLCLGSMGMAQMHTPEVREQAIRVAVEAASGQLPVLVGCGDCSTNRTLQYIRMAEKYRPDGIVLITPYFPKLTDAELYDYFTFLAAETELPIYLYDIPYYTNRQLTPELIIQLVATNPNIAGLKASGEMSTLRKCIDHFRDDPNFAVLSGHSSFLDHVLLMGADGIIDGLFAIAPKLGTELFRAAKHRDIDAARDLQNRLVEVREMLSVESVFASFSHVMNLLSIPGRYYCPPMKELTPDGKLCVEMRFNDLKIKLGDKFTF